MYPRHRNILHAAYLGSAKINLRKTIRCKDRIRKPREHKHRWRQRFRFGKTIESTRRNWQPGTGGSEVSLPSKSDDCNAGDVPMGDAPAAPAANPAAGEAMEQDNPQFQGLQAIYALEDIQAAQHAAALDAAGINPGEHPLIFDDKRQARQAQGAAEMEDVMPHPPDAAQPATAQATAAQPAGAHPALCLANRTFIRQIVIQQRLKLAFELLMLKAGR
ncbi:hypothetical protein B0H14DRAFT_2600151 [Mycena olivaceomarginata]|nr:hypothetical protein B0H14DRAFT_2600151 [Mycena olivaceomarginata]